MSLKYRLFAALAVTVLVSALAYLGGRPRITVINNAGVTLDEVRVQLPSSSVSFGPIGAGGHATIYYGWTQRPGIYRYRISTTKGDAAGACGRVGNHEFGKHLVLPVGEGLTVECRGGEWRTVHP